MLTFIKAKGNWNLHFTCKTFRGNTLSQEFFNQEFSYCNTQAHDIISFLFKYSKNVN